MENKFSEQFNFIGIGITVLAMILLSIFLDVESMKSWVMQVGIWTPLAFIVLKILTLVIAPLSGGPLYPLVGILFGFWPGIIYVAIGDFLGYTINFAISRIFGRKVVEKMLGQGNLLSKIIDHVGTPKGFFHAFLTLFVSPELLAYGAGLSKLSYWKFILILWPGYLVVSAVLVLLGSSLTFLQGSLIISLGIPIIGTICVLIGGWLFIRALKNKKP